MLPAERLVLAVAHPRGAGYDVVLLAHVVTAGIGLGAVVVSGAFAWVLRGSGPASDSVRRYYRPGVNWAGRVLFLVPVLGFALVAMSQGDWSLSDDWITWGLALWAGVAVVAEAALWPAERRLQEAVALESPPEAELAPLCLRVVGLAVGLALALAAAAAVMVAKP